MYDGRGGEPTKVPLLYLARDGLDIHIEFPHHDSIQVEDEEAV